MDEASAYLADPLLNERLGMVTEAILALPTCDAVDVFGVIDSYKLCSSMTLFDLVSPDDVFARVLDKYFNGRRDNLTLGVVGR